MKIQELIAVAWMVIVLGAIPIQSDADEEKEEKTEGATKMILSKQIGSDGKVTLYKRFEPRVYKRQEKTIHAPGELYWLEVERPKRKKPACAWTAHVHSSLNSAHFRLRDFMIAERDKDRVAIAYMLGFCVHFHEVDLTANVPFPPPPRTEKDLPGRPNENSPTFIPMPEIVSNRYGDKAFSGVSLPNLTGVTWRAGAWEVVVTTADKKSFTFIREEKETVWRLKE